MKATLQTPPKRAWVFGVAVTGAVACYVFLVFLPGQRATAELRQQFTQQLQYVQQCGQLGPKIVKLEDELRRVRQFSKTWHDTAPSEERLAHVFVTITEHANAARADIVRFEPQPAEHLDYLRRVPVEIALEGSFAQLFDFLGRLESLPAEFWLDRLDLQAVNAMPGRLRCELRMELFAGQSEISD